MAWHRGDARALADRLDRVDELLPGLADGEAKARVLIHAGRLRGLGYELERATELDEEGLELAEKLGLRELAASALTNLGTVRNYSGDYDGALELLERAASIGRAERSPELLRTLNNLMVVYNLLGRLVEHDETLAECDLLARELGDAAYWRFIQGAPTPGRTSCAAAGTRRCRRPPRSSRRPRPASHTGSSPRPTRSAL